MHNLGRFCALCSVKQVLDEAEGVVGRRVTGVWATQFALMLLFWLVNIETVAQASFCFGKGKYGLRHVGLQQEFNDRRASNPCETLAYMWNWTFKPNTFHGKTRDFCSMSKPHIVSEPPLSEPLEVQRPKPWTHNPQRLSFAYIGVRLLINGLL